MQICLFEVVNGVVVPEQCTLFIDWLRKIREIYPDDYLKVYGYLFYMSCWDSRNIYINRPEEERQEMIIQDLAIDFSLDDPIITNALERCKLLYETPTVRGFRTCKNKLTDIYDFLDDNKTTGGKNGNAGDVNMFMKQIPDYLEMYDKLEIKLKAEQHRVRGAKKIAYDQMDQMNNG